MSIKVETKITGTIDELLTANYLYIKDNKIKATDLLSNRKLSEMMINSFKKDNTYISEINRRLSTNENNEKEISTIVTYIVAE